MNINRRLQKIGRDLQEIAMEMGAKATKFTIARSPKQYRKGNYVRLYNDKGTDMDKRGRRFNIGWVIDKPRTRPSAGFTDMDGNLEELWEVEVVYKDAHGNFYETVVDWDYFYETWIIIDVNDIEMRTKIREPNKWNPPRNLK